MALQAMLAVLLVSSTLTFEASAGDIGISTGFMVFRGSEQSILEGLSPRERLDVAAKAYTSHIVNLTSASQAAVAQEGVNINLDCLPRLSEVPGGSIMWKSIQLDEFGNPVDPTMQPDEIPPSEADDLYLQRITVGGQFNRWLNISHVIVIQGAEDPDSKIFICEVCQARGTPSEQCNTTNFTLSVIGAPPVIKENLTNICLSRNNDTLVTLECDFVTLPYPLPLPQRSWFKDGEHIYSTQVRYYSIGSVPDTSEFLAANPLLALGVLDPLPFLALPNGKIVFHSQVENITSPSLLPPGTTLEQVREQLFTFLLGNWTCQLNNTLGNDSHTYVIRECDPPTSGFKVFKGNEQNILEGLSPREHLDVAAKYGESHVVELTSSSQAAVSQQGANINLDCLLWRNGSSQLQNGTIQWKFIQLDQFGKPHDPAMLPEVIAPNTGVEPPERITVGGQFNRWLNISSVITVQGAEDPDSKIFICEVCQARGTPSEQCNTANFTLSLIGAPPQNLYSDSSMCLSKNINDNKIARLACSYDRWTGPQPVPTPQISWYKDGELVYSELTGRYLNPNDSAFIAANPLLAYGVFDQVPFVALSSGNIFLLGSVTNITSPSLLPPGTTLKQAQDQLLTLLVGNWTCKLNNTLGSSSITYMIRECVPRASIPVPKVEGQCSIIIWESGVSESAVSCEDILGYNVRLYHPESSHRSLTRRVETDKTYYKISDKDIKNKDVKIDHETLIQVQIIHQDFRGEWSEAVSLGCEGPTETPSMYFELNNKVYLNNSAIRLRDIGEGERALLCKTDRKDCCGTPPNRYGEFYYPNGTSVPIASHQQGFYRNRGEQMIHLNRRSTATSPTGKYRCDIPGVDGEIQSIYVTLTA